MKRELAFALQAHSQLSESLGRTRSSKPIPIDLTRNGSIDQSPEIRDSKNKSGEINVYRRNKRLKFSSDSDIVEELKTDSEITEEPKVDSETKEEGNIDSVITKRGKKIVGPGVSGPRRFTRSALKAVPSENVQTETVKEDEVVLEAVGNVCKLKGTHKENVETKLVKEDVVVVEADGSVNELELKNTPRRLTRSARKAVSAEKVGTKLVKEDQGNVNELELENTPRRLTRSAKVISDERVETKLVKEDEGNVNESGLGNTPRRLTRSAKKVESAENVETKLVKEDEGNVNELELPKVDHIRLHKRPTTVKELLATGLLENYPVFYNGCGEKEFTLRGIIKGTGILCYCSLCKGARVVPPSAFEIHACKVYKRAAEYICFENGKSLLDVVKSCNKHSVKTLATNIQCIVGPLTRMEAIICQKCKGSFLKNHAGKMEQICDSCVDAVKLQFNSTKTTELDSRRSFGESCRLVTPASSCSSPTSAKMCNSSQRGRKRIINKKSSEQDLSPLSPRRASVRVFSQGNSQNAKMKRSSRSALDPESLVSASQNNMSQVKSKGRKLSKKMTPVRSTPRLYKSKGKLPKNMPSFPKSPRSAPPHTLSQNKSQKMISEKVSQSVPYQSSPKTTPSGQWKITKKDQKMHRLVFEKNGLPNGTEVAYFSQGQKLLEGYKTETGIFCSCCKSDISPSQFEAHAGWASRRKPYSYIYISNGVSLHEFALSLLLKRNKNSVRDNDDLCIICADGGDLLLCDGCPRSFHQECASLTTVPRGKWYCKFCQNMFQREKFVSHNANAIAAGRVSGVDVIGQITERCIRIVKKPEASKAIACVLCRGHDFSRTGFGPRTVILCDQCEKEYHVGCLKKRKMADLKELPMGEWFCCRECSRVYNSLQNLLVSGAEKLSDSLLDTIRKKHNDKGLGGVTNMDVRFRLLSSKISSRENRLLLSEACAIFHDRFDPIVDSASGRDYIPSMVYGRNIRGQDFSGMYCAILTVNSTVTSAGLLRVLGRDIAELPLVATTKENQGKGYFQLLFSCIEKLLAFLEVQSLVLPAAEEAESIWTNKLGFSKIPEDQLNNYKKRCWQMLTFKGTAMLEKAVPRCRITRQDSAVTDVSVDDIAYTKVSIDEQNTATAIVPDEVKGVDDSIKDQDADYASAEGRNVTIVDASTVENHAVAVVEDQVVDVDVSVKDQDVVYASAEGQDATIVDASIEDRDAAMVEDQVIDVDVSVKDQDVVYASAEGQDATIVDASIEDRDAAMVEDQVIDVDVSVKDQDVVYASAEGQDATIVDASIEDRDAAMVEDQVMDVDVSVKDQDVVYASAEGQDATIVYASIEDRDAAMVEDQVMEVDVSVKDQDAVYASGGGQDASIKDHGLAVVEDQAKLTANL